MYTNKCLFFFKNLFALHPFTSPSIYLSFHSTLHSSPFHTSRLFPFFYTIKQNCSQKKEQPPAYHLYLQQVTSNLFPFSFARTSHISKKRNNLLSIIFIYSRLTAACSFFYTNKQNYAQKKEQPISVDYPLLLDCNRFLPFLFQYVIAQRFARSPIIRLRADEINFLIHKDTIICHRNGRAFGEY